MREEMSSLKRELVGDREAADERNRRIQAGEDTDYFRRHMKSSSCLMKKSHAKLMLLKIACQRSQNILEEGMKLMSEKQN